MHEVLHYSRLAALRQSIRCNASYDERCDYKNLLFDNGSSVSIDNIIRLLANACITRDIIHAIVMTFFALFMQQHTLFLMQSVKSK